MNRFFRTFGPFFLLLSGLTACYEPREACLDINATNFAVDADRPCSDCCEYPNLRLAVNHRSVYPNTTVNFRLLDSVYFDRSGQAFRVAGIRFYLSDLHFMMADGTEAGVTDVIRLDVFNENGALEEKTLEDNFSLVTPSRVQAYQIGTFRTPGEFTALRFTLGLNDLANRADPVSLPVDHPLAPQPEDLYWSPDSGYVFNRIAIFRDTTAADTIPTVLQIGTEPYRLEVVLPVSGVIPEGQNLLVSLQIDYLRWFAGIEDVRQDPASDLIDAIVSGLAQSFSVVDIRAELP